MTRKEVRIFFLGAGTLAMTGAEPSGSNSRRTSIRYFSSARRARSSSRILFFCSSESSIEVSSSIRQKRVNCEGELSQLEFYPDGLLPLLASRGDLTVTDRLIRLSGTLLLRCRPLKQRFHSSHHFRGSQLQHFRQSYERSDCRASDSAFDQADVRPVKSAVEC